MKPAHVAAVLLAAVALAGCTAPLVGGDEDTSPESQIEAPEAGESARMRLPIGRESLRFTWVNVSAGGVTPERVVAANGTAIGWRNINDFGVYLSFPWMPRNFSIAAGKERTMLLQGETTYRAYRNDTQELIGEGYVKVGE